MIAINPVILGTVGEVPEVTLASAGVEVRQGRIPAVVRRLLGLAGFLLGAFALMLLLSGRADAAVLPDDLVGSVTAPVTPVVDNVDKTVHQVKQTVSTTVNTLSSTAVDTVSTAKKTVRDVVSRAQDVTVPVTGPLQLPPVGRTVAPVVDPITGPPGAHILPVVTTPDIPVSGNRKPAASDAEAVVAQANPATGGTASPASVPVSGPSVVAAPGKSSVSLALETAFPMSSWYEESAGTHRVTRNPAPDVPSAPTPVSAGAAAGAFVTPAFGAPARHDMGLGRVVEGRQDATPLWRSLKPGTSPD